ncbi:MAG: GNAT family N-acetyltransferase, partial [Candidatus Thorarchaeota archaeon]
MLEFIVGYDVEQFKEYYCNLSDLQTYYISIGSRNSGPFKLGGAEKQHLENNPKHLIIWTDNEEIVGHNIWHETSTEEMTPGDPRDVDDRDTLRKLFGGITENLVELHELWLRTEHRGKGYGRQFLDFFEEFISQNGFDGIVHYTDHPGVIALCRKRGYKEGFLEGPGWYVF